MDPYIKRLYLDVLAYDRRFYLRDQRIYYDEPGFGGFHSYYCSYNYCWLGQYFTGG